MTILKQKQNTPIFKDGIGNEYSQMAVALSFKTDVPNKTLQVDLKYYKDVDSIVSNYPVLVDSFYWDEFGSLPRDIQGNIIDWNTFMGTVPRAEWKDRIADIGRSPYAQLDGGLVMTFSGGIDFKQDALGQAWKEIMLFLPISQTFAQQAGVKFLDEVFEYHVV